MHGWIKIHRKFVDHWLYTKEKRPFTFREAWIDILLSVNHKKEKINFGYHLVQCNPGESLKSIKTWADRWRWSQPRVRRFLKLLKKDKMILIKNEQITTRLIICNWETYQINGRASDEQVTSIRRASDEQVTTNKNTKNDKNVKTVKNKDIVLLLNLERYNRVEDARGLNCFAVLT